MRREKNLTQEQLAACVGVSAPAVSKWETNTTCPDIALLSPLARALGTNVDTLLNFTPQLSAQQIAAFANEVAALAQERSTADAFARGEVLLHEYSNCMGLCYSLACLYLGFGTFGPEIPEASVRAEHLLRTVCESKDTTYYISAAHSLATLLIRQNQCDEAETLLNNLPKNQPEPEMLYPSLYLKQGRPADALRLVQQQTFQSLLHLQTNLTALCSTEIAGDPALRNHAHDIYAALEKLFAMGIPLADFIAVEIALEDGNLNKAAQRLLTAVQQFIDASDRPYTDLTLFPMFDGHASTEYTAMMCQMILRDLQTDKKYKPLQTTAQYKEALALLQNDEKTPLSDC